MSGDNREQHVDRYGGGEVIVTVDHEFKRTDVHLLDVAPATAIPGASGFAGRHAQRDQWLALNDAQLLTLHGVLTRALEARTERVMRDHK